MSDELNNCEAQFRDLDQAVFRLKEKEKNEGKHPLITFAITKCQLQLDILSDKMLSLKYEKEIVSFFDFIDKNCKLNEKYEALSDKEKLKVVDLFYEVVNNFENQSEENQILIFKYLENCPKKLYFKIKNPSPKMEMFIFNTFKDQMMLNLYGWVKIFTHQEVIDEIFKDENNYQLFILVKNPSDELFNKLAKNADFVKFIVRYYYDNKIEIPELWQRIIFMHHGFQKFTIDGKIYTCQHTQNIFYE